MLDEFPALGRLDFFESALAFMAGYGLRAYLIAQSLNQIEKAYAPNNSILDNCHVRVAFATNDERTAKRISDAIGSTTEMRAMKNYAGHRLAPWLSHVMVSRQETARQLMTPGEIMQLPADQELILLSGFPPIRAQKIRYYADKNFTGRVSPAPALSPGGTYPNSPPRTGCDWAGMIRPVDDRMVAATEKRHAKYDNKKGMGQKREPDLDVADDNIEQENPDLEATTNDGANEQSVTPIQLAAQTSGLVPLQLAHGLTQSVDPELGI